MWTSRMLSPEKAIANNIQGSIDNVAIRYFSTEIQCVASGKFSQVEFSMSIHFFANPDRVFRSEWRTVRYVDGRAFCSLEEVLDASHMACRSMSDEAAYMIGECFINGVAFEGMNQIGSPMYICHDENNNGVYIPYEVIVCNSKHDPSMNNYVSIVHDQVDRFLHARSKQIEREQRFMGDWDNADIRIPVQQMQELFREVDPWE